MLGQKARADEHVEDGLEQIDEDARADLRQQLLKLKCGRSAAPTCAPPEPKVSFPAHAQNTQAGMLIFGGVPGKSAPVSAA